MRQSSGIPAVSVLVPVFNDASHFETTPAILLAEPALVADLAGRGRRRVERYGWEGCAEADARLYDAAAAR